MRPVRISAENYRSFARLDFAFGAGATAIVGANGSGKSSLMGAVELALFGPRGRSLEPHVREGADSFRIELVFDHQGERYRVRRSWKAGKTTVDLEWYEVDDIWTAITQGTTADTQARIESIISLTRATFLASAYLAQRESDSFTGAQPRDRKRVLADALALDDWAAAAERAAVDRRAAEREKAEVDARIVVLTEQQLRGMELELEAERLAGDMRSAAELAEQAEAELVSAADRLRQAEQREAEWQSRSAALEVAAARLTPLKETAGLAALAADRAAGVAADILRLEGLAAELDRVTAEHAALAERDRERTDAVAERQRLTVEVARLTEERNRTMAAWHVAVAKLDGLAAGGVCDRCGQHVADDALTQARASLAAERADAEERTALLNQHIGDTERLLAAIVVPEPAVGLDVLAARIAETRTAPADLAAARERHATLQAQIERATEPEFLAALEQAEHDHRVAARQAAEAVRPEGVDLLRAACVSAKAAADVARQRHTNAQVQHARVVAQADQLEAAAAEHERLLARREQLRDDLDVLAELEKAFGRDGVPAWIVESQAVPAIEQEANRVLARLGGKISRVELRTEKTTAKGDTRDALDIVCVTAGGDRDLATFSGGEQARAEIACALGLARLLGARRGTDLRYLALDEPPGLDQQGTEALAGILKEIAQDGDVTVLLASHDPGLRDQFDQSALVETGPAGSTVTL